MVKNWAGIGVVSPISKIVGLDVGKIKIVMVCCCWDQARLFRCSLPRSVMQ